jgi:peroxiredoxin
MKTMSLFFLLLAAAIAPAWTNTGGLAVGEKARDFKLKNVDGKMVSLADFPGAKGFIVVFTCNTCPYAKAYEDRIAGLHRKFAADGFPVIAINPNDPSAQPGDSFEATVKRSKEKSFPFPYLTDESQETTRFYGATHTPHVYVLDKDLTVAYIGAIDNNYKDAAKADQKYVENAVQSLKSGVKADPESTKAIGCTIKWKQS